MNQNNDTLFAEERLNKIINILNKEGKVIVKDLSTQFDVTTDCIRKDLKKLEKQGILKRTYGGGILARKVANKEKVEERINSNLELKNKIAQKAFNLIEDKEAIFLDISTSNILLAKLIAQSDKELTIISNMTDIINALSSNSKLKIICPGGVYNTELDGFVGSMTIDNILKYKFNKAFIGSCGINIFDKSITTFDTDDGDTKKAMIEAAKEVFVITENKKFELDGLYKFSTLDDITGIITEEKPTSNICEVLKETDTKII